MGQLIRLGSLLAMPGGGGGGGGGGAYPVNAVHFGGTNEYLLRGGGLTGAAIGEDVLLSLWFNLTGKDNAITYMLDTDTSGFVLKRSSANKLIFSVENEASSTLWAFTSTDQFTTVVNSGWNHLLIAAQLDVTPVGLVYMNDAVLATSEAVAPTNGDIDFVEGEIAIGSTAAAEVPWDGDYAEFYFTDEFLDISVENNRRKFIDASGFPVDLGTGGITPTGTVPLIMMSGDTDTWHTNDGSGGGFTENGALTTASSSPSD